DGAVADTRTCANAVYGAARKNHAAAAAAPPRTRPNTSAIGQRRASAFSKAPVSALDGDVGRACQGCDSRGTDAARGSGDTLRGSSSGSGPAFLSVSERDTACPPWQEHRMPMTNDESRVTKE